MKTHRMWRELDDFQMVLLPGRGHTSGVAPGYIPSEYVPATVRFIDGNDFPVARKRPLRERRAGNVRPLNRPIVLNSSFVHQRLEGKRGIER